MSQAASLALLGLLHSSFPNVNTIVWDLDGTLGPMPGWDGTGRVAEYLTRPYELSILLTTLAATRGTYNVLGSRNGMFCGEYYPPTRSTFQQLGFRSVLPCYRQRQHSKVKAFDNPRSVLLIDDNVQECIWAAQDGAFALHVKDVALDAIPANNYDIYVPVDAAR